VSDAGFTRVPARWTQKFATGEIDFDQIGLMVVLAWRANHRTRRLHFRSYDGHVAHIGWKYGADQLRLRALPTRQP
jgi:hypothetical protein